MLVYLAVLFGLSWLISYRNLKELKPDATGFLWAIAGAAIFAITLMGLELLARNTGVFARPVVHHATGEITHYYNDWSGWRGVAAGILSSALAVVAVHFWTRAPEGSADTSSPRT